MDELLPARVECSELERAAIANLSNEELRARLRRLAVHSRLTNAATIAHLVEFDNRRLYADAGYDSLFAYCTAELGLSDGAAYRRISAARVAASFPAVVKLLAEGKVSLEGLALVRPSLTNSNFHQLMERIAGKSKREVEAIVAEIAPQNERRDNIREISPGRVSISFTAGNDFRQALERIRDMLRPDFPEGRLEDILGRLAGDFLFRHGEAEKTARSRTRQRRSDRRKIPRWVRSIVWKRDGGRCAFQSADGHPCGATRYLEFDHVLPWAKGGRSDDPNNIRVLCRAHNQLEARRKLGSDFLPF